MSRFYKLNTDFEKRAYVARYPREQYQIDLIDFNSEKKQKSGYIVNCIDVFSRYMSCVHVDSKDAPTLHAAMENCFSQMGGKPKNLQCDKEGGIYSTEVQEDLAKEGINLYSVEFAYDTMHSAAIVERLNLTMKMFMRDLRETKEFKGRWMWKQLILAVVERFPKYYNNKIHSFLGMTPAQALKDPSKFQRTQNIHIKHGSEYRDEPAKPLKVGNLVYAPLKMKPGGIRDKEQKKYHDQPVKITNMSLTNPPMYSLEGMKGKYYQQFLLKK